jgi:Ca-activated chloride channel family protein
LIARFLQHWFSQPQALWLLGLLPLLSLMGALAWRRRKRRLARWGTRPALVALTSVRRRRRWLQTGGRAIGLVCLIMGIAGPRWGFESSPAMATGRDLVVVLDLSRSMLAQDVLGQASPDRLGRAKDAIMDLVQTVKKRGGHRLGLVVFAARAQELCPLTHDYDHFGDVLAAVNPDNPFLDIGPTADSRSGTRIGAALRMAVNAHDPHARGHQDVLLISDGDDPAGDEEWRQGIEPARQEGIVVHTIGIGDPDNASPIPLGPDVPLLFQGQPVLTRLEEKPLKEIAERTGGSYTAARTLAIPMGEIFRERIESREGREHSDDVLPVQRQRSAWFFAAALSFLGLGMVFGDRRPIERVKRSRDLSGNGTQVNNGPSVLSETSL